MEVIFIKLLNLSQDFKEQEKLWKLSDVLLKRINHFEKNRRYYYWTYKRTKLVGFRFNPSGLNEVDKAKQLSADLHWHGTYDHDDKVTKETLLYLE
jgi:hypothetical protein